MSTWNINDTEQLLKDKLEQEKTAGIPSVPEGLKPENIQVLLEEKKKPVKHYLITGSMTAMAAAAAVLFLILPAAQKAVTRGVSDNEAAAGITMAETMAASYDISESSAMAVMQEDDAGEAGCGTVWEEALTKEMEILRTDGSYEAACLEGDYLYLLQKAEQHELYIINLAKPADWQRVFPEIPQEEDITEMEIKGQQIYFYNGTQESYSWSLEN